MPFKKRFKKNQEILIDEIARYISKNDNYWNVFLISGFENGHLEFCRKLFYYMKEECIKYDSPHFERVLIE